MIIAVAGGKRGSGKTTIATNLALALLSSSKSDDISHKHIAFADCDVMSPNAAGLLNPRITHTSPVETMIPVIDADKCTLCGRCVDVCVYHALAMIRDEILFFDELCLGCDSCRLCCSDKAIGRGSRQIGTLERGRVGSMIFIQGTLDVGRSLPETVIHQAKDSLKPRKDQVTIIDAPDGASSMLFETLRGCDYCLLVAESTRFGLYDLQRTVGIARDTMGIPVGLALVHTSQEDSLVNAYCEQANIPILMHLSHDQQIVQAQLQGIPLNIALPEYQDSFLTLYRRIVEEITQ